MDSDSGDDGTYEFRWLGWEEWEAEWSGWGWRNEVKVCDSLHKDICSPPMVESLQVYCKQTIEETFQPSEIESLDSFFIIMEIVHKVQ